MSTILNVPNSTRVPKFLIILFFVEMWERFSYYGMRSLLVLFLTSRLGYEDAKAYAIYSLFAAVGYAGPVLGGFLADKLTGFRSMVLLGGIIITIGHLSLTLVELESELIYIGLALIAVGTGMFKGNITNLLGSCYKEDDPERSRGFTLFYVGVNLGSFMASISCSYIAYLYGWHYGFGIAGGGMILGLTIFIKFQHLLGDNGISPRPKLMNKKILGLNIFTILMIASLLFALVVARMLISSEFFANILALCGILILGIFIYIIVKSSPLQRKRLTVLLILITFFMCFFALEMQLGSLVNLFTQRNVVNEILGLTIPPAAFQAINPFSIIIFGSLLGAYMKFDKKYATPIFAFGISTMAICFFILYIGCLNANIEGKIGLLYLVSGIAFIGLGELCIGPLIQEQATLLAPKHLKGLVMGIIMLFAAFANLAGILISKFMSIPSINGEVDCLESLEIYKKGFLKIATFNLGLALLFLPCYLFVNKVIAQTSTEKVDQKRQRK
ncbi:peptide MFS transporter [Candidatus Tisiphia endosymbiont of Temnostethus pusillus]|uniref:peptide MFS transporter n=1 Tax=Candidatus Tisiphia endosymbiont of Temnostethus pusillus TaxID=3139335 RepID=UPI0035C916E9